MKQTQIWISPTRMKKKAIEQANPALGDFVSYEQIERAYHSIPENEFRRYFLNQWTTTAERWFQLVFGKNVMKKKLLKKVQK